MEIEEIEEFVLWNLKDAEHTIIEYLENDAMEILKQYYIGRYDFCLELLKKHNPEKYAYLEFSYDRWQ